MVAVISSEVYVMFLVISPFGMEFLIQLCNRYCWRRMTV